MNDTDSGAGERGCRWSDARSRWEWEIRPGVSKEACGHLAHSRGDDLYMPDERPVVVTSATPDADDAHEWPACATYPNLGCVCRGALGQNTTTCTRKRTGDLTPIPAVSAETTDSGAGERSVCPDCGHQYERGGCIGPQTPSDKWAGVFPDQCDCDGICATPDADDAHECRCPPCPGRGNDGHGLTHCAECCFGTGVEAEPGCPIHHPLPAASTGASEVETLARLLERHGVSSVSGDRERGIAQALLASDWFAARESAAREQAWDEGYRASVPASSEPWTPPGNPYRAARIARGDA